MNDPQSQPAIVARQIEMIFQNGDFTLKALKAIDLTVPLGAIQLLMGPSGSGKTTLLSIVGGILTPTSGTVHLLGQEITSFSRNQLSRFRLQNIGFIFQDANLFSALTATQNIEAALNLKGIKGKEAKQIANHLLDQVGLSDRLHYLPKDLSGGQKERVAIARALAGSPPLIMADEPTAGLDSRNGHAIMERLRSVAKEEGCTVLVVTHDTRILDIADHVANVEDGMITPWQPSSTASLPT